MLYTVTVVAGKLCAGKTRRVIRSKAYIPSVFDKTNNLYTTAVHPLNIGDMCPIISVGGKPFLRCKMIVVAYPDWVSDAILCLCLLRVRVSVKYCYWDMRVRSSPRKLKVVAPRIEVTLQREVYCNYLLTVSSCQVERLVRKMNVYGND